MKILFSSEYGSGFVNDMGHDIATDAELIAAFEAGNQHAFAKRLRGLYFAKTGDSDDFIVSSWAHLGNAPLSVAVITEPSIVMEYDGLERIVKLSELTILKP